METTNTPALTLDSPDLSQAEYRALREGTPVTSTVETPEAPQTEAVNAEVETATETEPVEEQEESKQEEPKPKKDKLHARFSELTAKIRTLESQLAAKSGAVQTEPKITPATSDSADPEPDPEKFSDYTAWLKEFTKYQLRQENKAAEVARLQAEQQKAVEARAQTWQERVESAKAEFSDYAEVAQNPELPVTPAMGEAILESEIGTKILYHLGQNPAEAARIAKLSPASQVREIGKLEAKLESPKATESAPEPQTKTVVSKAPAPKKPVAGGASANFAKNIESMTQAEYRAYREAGKIR
jgi:hypothetical protein